MILFVCCLIAFTLTIDYSLSLISAQAYWIQAGGRKELAGLVFGLYDAMTIIISPLFSIYITKKGNYKTMFMIGLLINLTGNVFYAMTYYLMDPMMILIGRVISGIGASTVPLLMVFVTEVMKSDQQEKATSYVKYILALSKILGPLVSSLLTLLWYFDGTVGEFINMFTLVGWIPVFFDVTCLIFLLRLDDFNGSENKCSQSFQFCSVIKLFWPILLISFTETFMYWLFMGNAFLIATHHFHIINSDHELIKIYITGFIGFIGSFILFKCCKKIIANMISISSLIILFFLSTCLYFFTDSWAFYLAVGSTTFVYNLINYSLNLINDNIGKQMKHIFGSYISVGISLITIVEGLARFCGPTISTIFMLAINQSNSTNCNFENSEEYITSGCSFDNYLVQNLVCIVICTCISFLGFIPLNNRINQFIKHVNNEKKHLIMVNNQHQYQTVC